MKDQEPAQIKYWKLHELHKNAIEIVVKKIENLNCSATSELRVVVFLH